MKVTTAAALLENLTGLRTSDTSGTSSSAFAGIVSNLESDASAEQGAKDKGDYDFSNMTRQEIAAAGKQLFEDGKITLDELFRFDHPDGKLRWSADGSYAPLNPDDRIDFISETKQAIANMEETGEALRPKSIHGLMVGLLEKLNRL